MRFHVDFSSGTAMMSASAIAETAGGAVISTTPDYDGENDLAIIELPDDADVGYLEDLLQWDENVMSYRVV